MKGMALAGLLGAISGVGRSMEAKAVRNEERLREDNLEKIRQANHQVRREERIADAKTIAENKAAIKPSTPKPQKTFKLDDEVTGLPVMYQMTGDGTARKIEIEGQQQDRQAEQDLITATAIADERIDKMDGTLGFGGSDFKDYNGSKTQARSQFVQEALALIARQRSGKGRQDKPNQPSGIPTEYNAAFAKMRAANKAATTAQIDAFLKKNYNLQPR